MKMFRVPKIEGAFILWAVIYLISVILLHWRLNPNIFILLFIVGSVLGIFILDFVDWIIGYESSPIKGALGYGIIIVLSIFALTSTGNFLGKGLVLFLSLRYLYLARKEFLNTGNLTVWFNNINISINPKKSEVYLLISAGILLLQTIIFVLV